MMSWFPQLIATYFCCCCCDHTALEDTLGPSEEFSGLVQHDSQVQREQEVGSTGQGSNLTQPPQNTSCHVRASTSRPFFISYDCPLLSTSTPYDHHPNGFWNFPERAGWLLDGQRQHRMFPNEVESAWGTVLASLDDKFECRQRSIPAAFVKDRPKDALRIQCFKAAGDIASLSEEVAFLQAWLFFGVLAEVDVITGVHPKSLSEFVIKTHPDGLKKSLSTAPLDVLPHRWLAALGALNEADQRERWTRLLEVVQHVVSLQTSISRVRSNSQERRSLSYDECKVLLSIRLLFRAILLTLTLSMSPSSATDLPSVQLIMNPALAQSFPAEWDELKEFATEEMLEGGWCRSECQLLQEYDGVFNFFATRLNSGRWKMDHSHCGQWGCLADQVDESMYQTVHVESWCRCESVQVEAEELCEVLNRGVAPRIILTNDLDLKISDSQPYIAISHVWSHGLGNPHNNALPRCQIRRIASYIHQLQQPGDPKFALWIDTLCIPVQPDRKAQRKQAIKLMSQTYQDAAAVLVLDRELQRLNISQVSLLEQKLLTAFVGWTRRLWTLQEAALSNRLYVQTLSMPYSLQDTGSTESERDLLLSDICFRNDITHLTRSRIPPMATLQKTILETSSLGSDMNMFMTTTVFQRLTLAIQHRTTSKMEDEPVILAITLGLPVAPILDLPDTEARMSQLFVLLRDFPADIIFGLWGKLASRPFRWAPRSIMGLPLRSLQSFSPAARCDTRGLHASYQGFLIDEGHQTSSTLTTGQSYYVVDKESRMKYELSPREGSTPVLFPRQSALIYGTLPGHVAIVDILNRRADDGKDVIEAAVVGYSVMTGSGVGLEISTDSVLIEGSLTAKDQCWCIT